MKKIKSIGAMILTLVIVLGLMPFSSASAATIARGDRIWVDVVEAETTTIRFKLKQTNEDESYCLEFMSPNDLSKPHDVVTTNTSAANGMLRTYGTTEELMYMYNGGWVEEDEQNAQIIPDFTLNEAHDVMIKLDGTYFDGVSNVFISKIYVDNEYHGMFIRKNNNPISAINVYGPGGDVSGIDVEYISTVGAKSGYMDAKVSHTDFDKKLITVDFSETPSNYDFANKTVLKATNVAGGEKDIPLKAESTDGSRVVFSYTEELDNSSECMIMLPSGIESALVENETDTPRKMYRDIITFESNANILGEKDGTRVSSCDYNNGKADIWVNQPTGIDNSMIIVKEEDDEENLSHVYYHNETTWFNGHLSSTVGEITSISMDVKPLVNKLNTVMEFMLPGDSVAPVNIVFGSDGYILGLHNWAGSNAVTSPYPFDEQSLYWLNAGYIGEYEAGKWFNLRLEHNKTTKMVDIYIDGYNKLSLKVADNATNFGDIRVRDLGSGIENGVPIMRFDNIRVERRVPCVSYARFTDAENNTLMPFEKIKGGLSKVELKFNQTIEEATLNGNVKLMQGEDVIATTPSYDATNKIYTLTVTGDVVADEKVELVVDGVANSAGDKISYKTYVESFDGYINPFLQVLDSNGSDVTAITGGKKAFVNAGVENGTGKDVEARIMIAQYKGGKLINLYLHPVLEVEKNNYNGVFYDDAEPLEIKPVAGADTVEVYMWKNVAGSVPWTESVVLPVR